MGLVNLILRIKAEGAEAAKRGIDNLKESVEGLGRAASIGGAAFGALSVVVSGVGVSSAFQAAVELDSLTRGLATVSKDAQDLTGQMSRLREVAKLPGLGFEEAIQGSIRLQAAGLSASLAERSLSAFGNALASVGGGKDQLEGVIVALSQISSKGVVSAEEINQIAERVPQVRKLLAGAFGTSDTEAIQKMGITATDAINRIVTQAEKLPKASGGIKNFIENLSDAFQDALRPLGQGIVEMVEGSGGGVEKLLKGLGDIGRQVGEVFASIGKSGALQEVLNSFASLFSGGMNTGPLENIAATMLALAKDLPPALKTAFDYGKAVFGIALENVQEIGRWLSESSKSFRAGMVEVGKFLMQAVNALGKLFADIYNSAAPFLKLGGKMAVQFSPIGMAADGIFSDRDSASPLNLKAFPKFDTSKFSAIGADRDRFLSGIAANRGPLKSLPSDLIFGGAASGMDGVPKPSTMKDTIDALLARIEQNTRKTAEAVSLKELSTGGSDLATPTALELRRAGGIGRGSGDYKAAAGYVSSDLERVLVARVIDQLRQGGAGLSPARQQ